jgi:hypothetical protein
MYRGMNFIFEVYYFIISIMLVSIEHTNSKSLYFLYIIFFRIIRRLKVVVKLRSSSSPSCEKTAKKAIENFENIKEAIKGIYEVFRINFNKENVYYKIGIDNIIALYTNIIELGANESGLKEILNKLKKSELELDIPLDL